MTSVQQSLVPNTFSVLSSMTPNVQRPVIPQSSSVPLTSTQLSSARLTGFVPPNATVVPTTSPISVIQTVNSPFPQPSSSMSQPGAYVGQASTSQPGPYVGQASTSQPGSYVGQASMSQPGSSIARTNIPIAQPSPSARILPGATSNNLTGQSSIQGSSQIPSSPSARSAILNLSPTASSNSSVVIPNIPKGSGPLNQNESRQSSLLFPSIKGVNPNSSLPLKPTAEIMNKEFEVKDYQGIIANASLENELLNAGYAPLSKIVVRTDGGEKRTQYIKAVNKMGQKVFILIDVNGYTTARSSDLTLIEAHNVSIVPYSLKTGAYNCAGKDVCGVAFECGSDAVCVLSRAPDDLTPKEANFVFVEQNAPSAATIESEGTIMTYPVIRLSEIRANPLLVLQNTDAVTRRLRNSGYTSLLQELATTQQSINKLNEAFVHFNSMRENVATKLNSTLTQLEQWNSVYMSNPPNTDEGKDKYRALQYNLSLRNENIAVLLRSMKKIADLHVAIDAIAKEINDITEFDEKEFINVDRAVSD